MVLEAQPHDDPWSTWAFVVLDGRICGAQGPGELGDLAGWLPRRCQQGHMVDTSSVDVTCADDANGLDHPTFGPLAASFVRERFLDQLLACHREGARATLYVGGLAWHDHMVPSHYAPSFDHVILEHARRTDEYPNLVAALGALEGVPRSARPPRETMASNLAELAAIRGDQPNLGWDFVDAPDEAATEEWRDVRWVYSLCDATRTLEDIVQLSMLGRFRTTAALATLVRCGNVSIAGAAANTAGGAQRTSPAAIDEAFDSTPDDDDGDPLFDASAALVDLDDDVAA